MGHIARIVAALAILAAGTAPLAAFDGPTQTTAPKKKAGATDKPAEAAADQKNGAADDKQKAAALAQRALDAGIKLYEAGKADQAVKAFETALHGGLTSQQMARGLYYRGLANRKLGKPGLAISDLTSAVWLKDGLAGPEREVALKNRAAAYQEAGISNVPDVPAPVMTADTSSATGWQTAMNGAPVAPVPPAAPAAPPAPVKTAAAVPPPAYAEAPSSAPAAAPAPAPPAATSSSGGIGGFFSNLFGGGTSSTPNANDGSVTTASITPSPPPAAAPAAPVTGWSGTTQVTGPEIGSPFVTKVATSGKASRAEKAAAREPSGKFRLQVAAVRSRSEADALAASLVEKHGTELGPRRPEVDEAVLGNMGTFYRVRVGPYADAKEPQQLCSGLRSSGFDCLVVTQ